MINWLIGSSNDNLRVRIEPNPQLFFEQLNGNKIRKQPDRPESANNTSLAVAIATKYYRNNIMM